MKCIKCKNHTKSVTITGLCMKCVATKGVLEMLSKKERDRLKEFLQSIATLAVQAQSEDGEDLADTLDYIRGDLNQCDTILVEHDEQLKS